jgi:uncharacterized Tic20 family protein
MNEPNVPLSGAGAVPQDRTLEVLCHLLGLAALTGIPFANVLAPLGLWLWKRESNPAVDAHGREAINFQLTAAIALVLSGFLCLILVGFILLPVVLIGQIAFTIIGSLRAGRGELYRYPLAIRFFN